MDNSEMKAGRFLKLHNGRKLFAKIQNTLAAGGVVIIATYTKATQLSKPCHAELVRLGTSGSVYLKHGKSWNCIDGCGFRFGLPA